MKRKLKIIPVVILILLMFTATSAKSLTQTINVNLNDVNLEINGKQIEADTMLFEGVTYVPLRAAAEMLDKNVSWNGTTRTASINDSKSDDNFKSKYNSLLKEYDSLKIEYDKLQETYATSLNLEKIVQVYEIVDKYHVYNQIDPVKMTDKAVQGLLVGLDEGYTSYQTKSEYEDSKRSNLYGTYGGIGVVVIIDEGLVKVVSPYKGTPAHKAGLKSGDIITHIDGQPIRSLDIHTVGDLVRGEPGSIITLTIISAKNGNVVEIQMEREVIEIPYVDWKLIGRNKEIAHINLLSFSRIAVEQLDNAISEALEQGAQKILLDLRGNPGGDLEATLDIADLFLDKDKIVFVAQDVNKKEKIFTTENSAKYDQPLYVLVDKGSASASEVISGTIKENNRGKIIGYNTFGKASMQSGFILKDESHIWVTTHTYLTPDRDNINHKGITPDYILDEELLDNEQAHEDILKAALETIYSEGK